MKEQLNEVLVNKIKTEIVKLRNTIIVTSKDPIPFKVTNESIDEQVGLKKNQGEADTILIHKVAAIGPGKTVVISNDKDVFVLLLHFICTSDIKANVLMQPTSAGSDKLIGITATFIISIHLYFT